jgi:hypothetical protein
VPSIDSLIATSNSRFSRSPLFRFTFSAARTLKHATFGSRPISLFGFPITRDYSDLM